MPSRQYSLGAGGSRRIELSWGLVPGSEYTVVLDGKRLAGGFTRELAKPRVVRLPDGSALTIARRVLDLQLRRDGGALPGSTPEVPICMSQIIIGLWVLGPGFAAATLAAWGCSAVTGGVYYWDLNTWLCAWAAIVGIVFWGAATYSVARGLLQMRSWARWCAALLFSLMLAVLIPLVPASPLRIYFLGMIVLAFASPILGLLLAGPHFRVPCVAPVPTERATAGRPAEPGSGPREAGHTAPTREAGHPFQQLRAAGCSLAQIARELGVSHSTVSEWERRFAAQGGPDRGPEQRQQLSPPGPESQANWFSRWAPQALLLGGITLAAVAAVYLVLPSAADWGWSVPCRVRPSTHGLVLEIRCDQFATPFSQETAGFRDVSVTYVRNAAPGQAIGYALIPGGIAAIGIDTVKGTDWGFAGLTTHWTWFRSSGAIIAVADLGISQNAWVTSHRLRLLVPKSIFAGRGLAAIRMPDPKRRGDPAEAFEVEFDFSRWSEATP